MGAPERLLAVVVSVMAWLFGGVQRLCAHNRAPTYLENGKCMPFVVHPLLLVLASFTGGEITPLTD